MTTTHPAMLDTMREKLAEIEKELREALLWDRYARSESTQNLMVEHFLQNGNIILHGGEPSTKAPQLYDVCDAARHFGNKVLGEVGDNLRKLLKSIAVDSHSSRDHEYAMNNACHCVDMLMSLWFAEKVLEVNIAAAEIVEDDTEQLERTRKDLQDIGENYRREMATPAGLRVLEGLRLDCNYIQNRRAMLPSDVEVPWFLRD